MTTVTVIGLNGANGTSGTEDPGLAGQSVTATAGTANVEDNSATAQGGNGGEGGTLTQGGISTTGHGGQGGDATASAGISLALAEGGGDGLTPTAIAMALGGNGGAGGPAFGGGNAAASAHATNTLGDAAADATAQGGSGGFSVAGSPFSPPGSPSGSAVAHAAGAATASFTAIGGTGSGVTSPALGIAGAGAGIGQISAMAVGVTAASATVTATGGAGGEGDGHAPAHLAAAGGAGAEIVLNNSVSGSTKDGSLVLAQIANGGTGGNSVGDSFKGIGNGAAGSGGSATSMLSLTDTTSASVQLNATAHGGESGLGRFLDFHGGGAGTASSALVGAENVTAVALATGGLSRNHAPMDGAATATATATGHGQVTAIAQAGSAPQTARLRAAANATATALNLGKTGFALAEASANGTGGGAGIATATGAQDGVTATAVTSEPDSSGIAGATSEVLTGTVGPIDGGGGNGVSVLADAGLGFDTTNVPLPPSLQAVFDSPRTRILGAANLGTGVSISRINPTLSHTYTQSIDWSVATASLKSGAILVAGFADANIINAGFDKLVLNISENGATVTNKVFTTVAAATAYFTNHVVNLGAWHNNGSGTLSLKIQLSITDTNVANQGVFIDVEAGLKPPPAQFIAPPASLPDLLRAWDAAASIQQTAADHHVAISDPDAWTPTSQASDVAYDWHPPHAAAVLIPHHHA